MAIDETNAREIGAPGPGPGPDQLRDAYPGLLELALCDLDGDTYESTWVTRQALYPGLAKSGNLIVDDCGFVPACRQAVDDYRAAHGIAEPTERERELAELRRELGSFAR